MLGAALEEALNEALEVSWMGHHSWDTTQLQSGAGRPLFHNITSDTDNHLHGLALNAAEFVFPEQDRENSPLAISSPAVNVGRARALNASSVFNDADENLQNLPPPPCDSFQAGNEPEAAEVDPSCTLTTTSIHRVSKTKCCTLVETHDSVWVYDTSACERVEGQCSVFKLVCLRGPSRGRDLVVKHADDLDKTRALVHEARVLAAATECPHIVGLAYPLVTDGVRGYLIQPRPAGNLAALAACYGEIHATSSLTWTPLLETMLQAFLAIHSLHQLDLVHSNVSYNCLQYYDGPCGSDAPVVLKLTGLEASVPPGTYALTELDDGCVLVAPEARAGVYRADFAMDVYSMAVTLAGFLRQVLNPAVASAAPCAPAACAPAWLPPGVASVLGQCIEHDPRARCSAARAAAACIALLESDLAGQICRAM